MRLYFCARRPGEGRDPAVYPIESYREKEESNSLAFLLLVIPVKTGIHCF